MSKATGFYAVCEGREIGVFTSWDEAQTYIQGYSGAKYKKFKTKPEAELWYRTNLPQATTNPQTSTISSSTATLTNSSRTGVTHTLSTPPPIAVSKPTSQSVSRAVTTPAPQPVQIPRIAVPKNNTADIVYSDGACKSNGGHGAVGGIGVWWGPNDTRNLSERCPGVQTNNRAELIAIARVLETVPPSKNTLIIRTDSQYSINALTIWSSKWRKNGWKNSAKKPVLNKEIIGYILTLLETRHSSGQPVQLEYVKGHSGDVGNDGADALAVAGCNHPETPERDWAGLKRSNSHAAEQDMMQDLTDFDPTGFILNDEDLMRELEEDS